MKVRDRTKAAPPAKAAPAKTFEYAHLPLNEDLSAFAGYYTPESETRLPFRGREVLYATGHCVIEATCSSATCEAADYRYGMIAGYIVDWQHRKDELGRPITVVEPVTDYAARRELEGIVLGREDVTRVNFR